MIAKFNPTGTHMHNGFLKVRIDLYPEVGDKTYAIHHIQVPIFPLEGYLGEVDKEGVPIDQTNYDAWVNGLPKVWQLNPCLCYFIAIDPDASLDNLTQYVRGIFDKKTLRELDDLLSEPKTDLVKLGQVMKPKCGTGKQVLLSIDIIKLNSRLSLLGVKV